MTLDLKAIAISLGDQVLVKPFSASIAPGEVVTVMGPSGSGKSTILSFIGGDLDPAFTATGEIMLNGRHLNSVPPEQRAIGRMFQDDLLFPHMTVAENLAFACARKPRAEREHMIHDALKTAELENFGGRAPHTLSGGQRMRVSLMRTLLANPDAILLDEPFSKLDRELRATMRDFTFAHIRQRNMPAVIVTHDIEDAPAKARILKITRDHEVIHA